MKEFYEAGSLLEKLELKVQEIEELIERKETELAQKSKELEEHEKELDRILYEKAELEEILNNCSVDICQYKIAFEEIRETYDNHIKDRISGQKFHFFLCYRGEYYARQGKKVIDAHIEVIDKHGFCWWAKFFKARVKGGSYQELEPFGESIKIDGSTAVARNIKEKLEERIANGDCIYLYAYNPNPPDIRLYACNVTDFYYGKEKIPYEDQQNNGPPQCAFIPRYYFYKRGGNCKACKRIDPKQCALRFKSNFWFKINAVKELENVEEEFTNLENCFTRDSINFAIPIFYPLLVSQREQRLHFQELVKPIPHKSGYSLLIPKREKGHTKLEKVKGFFDALNQECEQSFVRVESIDCPPPYSGKPEMQQSNKDSEIIFYLPAEFRSDGKAIRFRIYLDDKTKPEQREKVKELMGNYLS